MIPGFAVDLKSEAKLLATLADMDERARNKLTRSSLRQAMGPLQRQIRRDWKSHPTIGTGDNTVRKAIARATLIQVGRYHYKGQMPRGPWGARARAIRTMYSKVYISYKKKYGPARLAHLLENPNGKYPTTYTSWEIHTKAFRKWHGTSRKVFRASARAFLAGYQMKDIRKSVKGTFG
tara:strand:+ start:4927 stop:5460 length:534 start_codon:yes stop_codon:yes gene_type:complete